MANEVDINIGTFDLDSSNNVAIEDIQVSIMKSVAEHALPKYHGSVIAIGKRKSMTVRIRGSVKGSDYDALRTSLDSLKNAFDDTAEKKFTTDDDRQLFVQYRNFSYSWEAIRTFLRFSVELIASDPFWLSQTLNSDSRTPSTGVGYTITNAGNAPTRVKVTITAGAGGIVANDIKLQNTTVGETFQYNAAVAAAQDVVVNNKVDTPDLVVTNNGVSDFQKFEGDFITLNPGANTIVFTSLAVNPVVKLEWRDAYK